MLRIEFPAGNRELAYAIGSALKEYGSALNGGVTYEPDKDEGRPGSDGIEYPDDSGPERNEDVEPEAETTTGPVDVNGVAFSHLYCAEAKEPFYSSGKHKGQWKKKRGVSDTAYDEWYGKAAGAAARQPASGGDDEPVNTAAAFGGESDPLITSAPTNSGEFMVWVSELQAGGHITQDDIGEAYHRAGLAVTDLFVEDEETVRANVNALFAILNAKVSA